MGLEIIMVCDICGKKIKVDEDRFIIKSQTGARERSKDKSTWQVLTRKEKKIATLCKECFVKIINQKNIKVI